MSEAAYQRLDDLRHHATALAVGVGVPPARAAALASHLLWYDVAGWPAFGLATLAGWLERIERGEVDPKAEGTIGPEHAATAVFQAQRGLAPLILARAAGLAGEKAREVGVGVVRIVGLGPAGPAAAVAAEMALGPEIGLVLGPGPSCALAIPSPEGLPVVFDSALAVAAEMPPTLAALASPWVALVPDGGYLIAALAVNALEPLATFHDRLHSTLEDGAELPGRLLPGPWDARRRSARERGLDLGPVLAALAPWAERLGVAPPPSLPPIR